MKQKKKQHSVNERTIESELNGFYEQTAIISLLNVT